MHLLQEVHNHNVENSPETLVQDTKQLQMESLILMMDVFGYDTSMSNDENSINPEDWDKIHHFYKVRDDYFSGNNPNFLSFTNAIMLHNGVMCRWVGGFVDVLGIRNAGSSLKFRTETMEAAKKAKLVARAKLQKISGGDIIVQNHLVELVNV